MLHPFFRPLLASTSALIGVGALLLPLPAAAVFDPGADGAAPASISNKRANLPDTSVLNDEMPMRPLYSTGPMPVNTTSSAASTDTSVPAYISPLEPIKMPRPLYPSRVNAPAMVATPAPAVIIPIAPAPSIAAAPVIIAPAPVIIAAPVVATPAPKVIAAPAIIAPAPVIATAPVVVTPAPVIVATPNPMPALPPVDTATAARAEEMLRAESSVAMPAELPAPVVVAAPAPAVIVPATVVAQAPAPVVIVPAPTATVAPQVAAAPFIAPAPIFAREALIPAPMPVAPTPVAVAVAPVAVKAPVVVAAPVIIAKPEPVGAPIMPTPPAVAVVATAPVVVERYAPSTLSEQTRTILSDIPAKMDSPVVQPRSKVTMSHVSPQIQSVLGKQAQEENYESVGLSIKVRRPGLDTNTELNNAYTSLMGGDTQRAIEIYKNIVSVEPTNEDALFGLAATYHRLGMTEQARPFYGMLLKQNPNHREALNNFLVLVSDESPQDALPELERLEARNPDFSPIPAQIAIVLDKLGYPDQAEQKMLRAIDLAPENLTYKYNLAIMLDHHQRYEDATALYRMLIEASLRGEPVPASLESMQKRLTYLSTAMAEGRAGG